jgi:hypothetical protein
LDELVSTIEHAAIVEEADSPDSIQRQEAAHAPVTADTSGIGKEPAQAGEQAGRAGAQEIEQAPAVVEPHGNERDRGEAGAVEQNSAALTADEAAAIANLPPVERGQVRLYRGEYGGEPAQFPDWLEQARVERGITDAQGRWFTDKPEIAKWYVHNAGEHGRMLYLDAPKGVAERGRVAGIPSARKFSADPDNEFFLPTVFRGKARPIPPAHKPPTPQVPAEQGTKYVLPSFVTNQYATKKPTRGGKEPSDWTEIGEGYAIRSTPENGGERQEIRTPEGNILIRGVDTNGKSYEEYEGGGNPLAPGGMAWVDRALQKLGERAKRPKVEAPTVTRDEAAAEPALGAVDHITTAYLEKLAKRVVTENLAGKAAARREIDDLMTQMEAEGRKIAEHCLETAGKFSLRG